MEVDNNWARIPIIAMTADVVSEVAEHCIKCGMDEVTYKPISAAKVGEVVHRFSKIVAQRRAEKAKQT